MCHSVIFVTPEPTQSIWKILTTINVDINKASRKAKMTLQVMKVPWILDRCPISSIWLLALTCPFPLRLHSVLTHLPSKEIPSLADQRALCLSLCPTLEQCQRLHLVDTKSNLPSVTTLYQGSSWIDPLATSWLTSFSTVKGPHRARLAKKGPVVSRADKTPLSRHYNQ